MPYEIVKEDETYYVKKDDKVHMRVHGPLKGIPPERAGHSSTGQDVDYSIAIAAGAVRYVREMLPLGAFNNQMFINGEYKYLTSNIAPRWLAARAETLYSSLIFRGDVLCDPVTQMAARSLATLSVGGGVCSLMTYVTAGYLTTVAKRGTKIVAVFDNNYNHEYVVLYYGTSPYVVADPWVGTSYVCFWDDCIFTRNNVHSYSSMEMGETLTIPYGVELAGRVVDNAKKAADIPLIQNPPQNQILPPEEQGLDKKDSYPWFHMDDAYSHPDNIKPGKRKDYRSVAGPADWGPPDKRTQSTYSGDRPNVLDWAAQSCVDFVDQAALDHTE